MTASLLNIQGQEISPRDVEVGAELLHYQLPMKDCYFNWIHTIPFINDYYDPVIKSQLFKCWLGQRSRFIEYDKSIKITGMKVHENDIFSYNHALMTEIYLCATQIFKYDVSFQLDSCLIIYPFIEYRNNKGSDVRNIFEIEYIGFVYDLTTENHHFAAGMGDIIVHNTDSVFFTFNLHTPEGESIKGKKALEITIGISIFKTTT